jgi:hypothetical protein
LEGGITNHSLLSLLSLISYISYYEGVTVADFRKSSIIHTPSNHNQQYKPLKSYYPRRYVPPTDLGVGIRLDDIYHVDYLNSLAEKDDESTGSDEDVVDNINEDDNDNDIVSSSSQQPSPSHRSSNISTSRDQNDHETSPATQPFNLYLHRDNDNDMNPIKKRASLVIDSILANFINNAISNIN